jgi:hypothetical protein
MLLLIPDHPCCLLLLLLRYTLPSHAHASA